MKVVLAVAAIARLAVVAWAAGRIPPTADGTYYHVVAQRIAQGQGYTWLWPDGAVTYAAHYPVGYPGMIGIAYAIFGSSPVVAMIVNAILGTFAAGAAFDLVDRANRGGSLKRRARTKKLALAAGLAVGLHPALVPYTAAMMTEGVAAALVIIAAALAGRACEAKARAMIWVVGAGLVMGIATLVRPQCVVMAPVLGWLAVKADDAAGVRAELRRRFTFAGVLTIAALGVCAPWTARNCARMDRCALVSVNGGWNLAIGTQTTSGGWHELKVPDECKEVFAEAAKDECFGAAAKREIAAHPGAWLARVPSKLRQTFDYFGAAPWYLHTANAEAFPYRAKLALGSLETLVARLFLAAALVAVMRLSGPRVLARKIVCGVGLVACVLVPGTIGYLACALAIALVGPRMLERLPLIVPATAALILATAATHAVFFGAGRYGLVIVPMLTALAFVRVQRPGGLGFGSP